ncbi:MAG: cob(I)yrinic acid a,c-diamide adenosyltransferase [Gemmataceae bacterium]
MVFLSKIYTKAGDQGETGLGDGTRVSKDHPRVQAYGSVDELNATIGLLVAQGLAEDTEKELVTIFRDIQNDLFDLGADLCVPENNEEADQKRLRVREEQVTRLEKLIDQYNTRLEPLRTFVLPGGSVTAAWCHLARTVCRRAEREVVALAHHESVNKVALIYLNRLSDLLFVMGRICNDDGKADVLWEPGRTVAKQK